MFRAHPGWPGLRTSLSDVADRTVLRKCTYAEILPFPALFSPPVVLFS
jgi:hypothetical protein